MYYCRSFILAVTLPNVVQMKQNAYSFSERSSNVVTNFKKISTILELNVEHFDVHKSFCILRTEPARNRNSRFTVAWNLNAKRQNAPSAPAVQPKTVAYFTSEMALTRNTFFFLFFVWVGEMSVKCKYRSNGENENNSAIARRHTTSARRKRERRRETRERLKADPRPGGAG